MNRTNIKQVIQEGIADNGYILENEILKRSGVSRYIYKGLIERICLENQWEVISLNEKYIDYLGVCKDDIGNGYPKVVIEMIPEEIDKKLRSPEYYKRRSRYRSNRL